MRPDEDGEGSGPRTPLPRGMCQHRSLPARSPARCRPICTHGYARRRGVGPPRCRLCALYAALPCLRHYLSNPTAPAPPVASLALTCAATTRHARSSSRHPCSGLHAVHGAPLRRFTGRYAVLRTPSSLVAPTARWWRAPARARYACSRSGIRRTAWSIHLASPSPAPAPTSHGLRDGVVGPRGQWVMRPLPLPPSSPQHHMGGMGLDSGPPVGS